MNLKRIAFIFCWFTVLVQGIALAESYTAAHTTVELVSDQKSIQPGQSMRIALKMSMDDEWHVYWKNPGDSGLPPTIQWELPDGFKVGDIYWPVPKLISAGPLTSYGYEGEVFLISDVLAPADLPAGGVVEIRARVDWLACKVDCIPGRADLQLSLPVDDNTPQVDGTIASDFKKSSNSWPVRSNAWNITISDLGKELLLTGISENDSREISEVLFFPDRSDLIDHAATQKVKTLTNGFELRVPKSNLFPQEVASIQGILVRSDGWFSSGDAPSLFVDRPLQKSADVLVPSKGTMTLWAACAFAFLGGLILNLMPCVLPILSLKILGLVKHSAHRAQMLAHGFIFTVGVLVSFWILAGILIALKQAGQGIGWGFQFQSPWFVIVIALVLFLCALNLWGVFEVAVNITPLTSLSKSRGYAGSFWGGVLATIVATPCTAPFMGTAIGFAIAQPPVVALLVFTCLALGMAMPYLILSAFPGVLKWVPKPGPWMVHLRSWLAFLLMGSVVWLVWVLGIQKGVYGIGMLLSGLLGIALGCWLLGMTQQEGLSWGKSFPMGAAFIVGLVLMFAAAVTPYNALQSSAQFNDQGIDWQEFSEELVLDLRSQNKAVFIDFTAAWCLTCQVNDRLVFRHKDVVAVFKEMGISALKADWTNRDERITRALAGYGKSSIPLYVFYPAGSSGTVILPELVTPKLVVAELRKAAEKD